MRKLTITLLAFILGMVLSACSATSETSESNTSEKEIELDEIFGIEPGSGTMNMAADTVKEYNLDMELVPSSEPAMITELEGAIKEERPIVVTLWQPHWAFDNYDLKILEDPKETISVEQKIHTIVRQGLKEEKLSAYQFLDNFYWEIEDMNAVMATFGQDEDVEPREAAKVWIEDNREKVESWMEGVEPVENEPIELAYINWDTELSSTNVVALLLEELGFDVTLTALDMGIAFKSLSEGEVDGMLIAWLPGGASTYMEQYEGEIDDLGPNLEGAKQGFVVPAYMDIDSVEDLPKK